MQVRMDNRHILCVKNVIIYARKKKRMVSYFLKKKKCKKKKKKKKKHLVVVSSVFETFDFCFSCPMSPSRYSFVFFLVIFPFLPKHVGGAVGD